MMSAFCNFAADYEWCQGRPGLYGKNIRIRKVPVGVVAAVVPWNMPQFLTVTKVVPALLAGCSVVLKPAPESVLDAQLLADLVAAADLPVRRCQKQRIWSRTRQRGHRQLYRQPIDFGRGRLRFCASVKLAARSAGCGHARPDAAVRSAMRPCLARTVTRPSI